MLLKQLFDKVLLTTNRAQKRMARRQNQKQWGDFSSHHIVSAEMTATPMAETLSFPTKPNFSDRISKPRLINAKVAEEVLQALLLKFKLGFSSTIS
jgi:hypothetical protein